MTTDHLLKPGALIALLLLAAPSCRHEQVEAAPPQAPAGEVWLTPKQVQEAKITVVAAGDEDVGGVVSASGKVQMPDLRVAHVYSPVTGRVSKILANPGERVRRGAPLAIIQSPDVSSAFSDLTKAQADLVASEHDFKRQKELYEAHAASQKDYEQSQDNYGKAKAELERARSKARLLRGGTADGATQEFTLSSPIEGEVIARNVSPGVEVQGQYTQGSAVELFTIGDFDPLWVVADVFEMDVGRVKKDARVTVKVAAYPHKLFRGNVEWVSGALDPVSRTAKVRCALANPDRELKPEMYATVTISVAERKALAIPRTALIRLGDQMVVFVQAGDAPRGLLRFERRPVAVDEEDGGDFLPVTHGLEHGDKVVTSGAILLSGMI